MKIPTLFKLLAASSVLATSAQAADLFFGTRTHVSTNNANFDISVVDGNAGYNDRGVGGTEPGIPTIRNPFGDGTIVDYNFVGNDGSGSALTTYASGTAGLIPTPTGNFVHGPGEEWANVWTTSDPGSSLEFSDTAKDHNPTGVVGAANTFARVAEVDGTIDISTLTLGTVYIPHGSFNNGWTLTLTMSGPGQPDIVAEDSELTIGNINNGWISEFNFSDATAYTSIAYSYRHEDIVDASPGSRARFMGVILEGSNITGVDDSDGDFLPDLWEDANFGNNNGTVEAADLTGSDGTGDADNDGATDRQEFTAGSDPNDKDSDGDNLEDGPEINTHGSDPTKIDTDEDTLTDDVEVNTHGSDPTLADTDGDTLTDDEEVVDGADGFITDPTLADTDDDGVSDETDTEPTDHTNDNDGDGLGNRDERDVHMTDPLVDDSDGDTILDGEEVETGADGFITNPNEADSDADGFTDPIEIAGGSNPTDSNSTPSGVSNISLTERVLVSENNANFDISVFPGTAGYNDRGILGTEPGAPTFRNLFGEGTVLDYNFIGNDGTGSALTTYASGEEGLIPTPTAPGENVHGTGEDWANVWTTNDPGADLEFTGSLKNHNPGVVGAANTFARCAEVTGTVDITGIGEGTLYIPHGTFINQWTLTMTMSGPGQPDIVAIDTQDVNGTGRNFGWITSFNFVNKAGYDTITYNYTNADRDGSRARFMGVILVADGAGSQGLQVTDVNYIGGDNVDIELTFNSREGRTYTIFTSGDLSLPLDSWDELDDSFPAEPDSDSSVFSVSLAPFGILPGGKQFFVVREN